LILFPAIDIRGGRAVRLVRGDFDQETVYADDPYAAAGAWVAAGASALHVVDLDGARDGAPANLDHLRRIAGGLGVPVQYGGGLRSVEAVGEALAAGAAHVVVGTAAYEGTDFLDTLLRTWPDRVSVGVDVREGRVSVSGWTEDTAMPWEEAVASMERRGVTRFVYTNADRDGMLEGADVAEVARVAEVVTGRFVYSGGITTLEDLTNLRALGLSNLEGVISGKALYERRFTLAEASAALRGPPA
jgi:phosphoribosylformimino-5-aminoimidazole carboxamide ribotide isomerase